MLFNSYSNKRLALNRYGPGGGTRRLHHYHYKGGEIGSTCVGIIKNFARNGTNVIGLKLINANDNEMALAA